MNSCRKMVIPVLGVLLMASVLLIRQFAWAQSSPPPAVAEEARRARTDFANGGPGRVRSNWNSCVERARASQDANAAERCIVYGYGALRLDESSASESSRPGMHALTAGVVTLAQIEMMEIMGIPAGPRQAWLDRYRRWVSEGGTQPEGRSRPAGRGQPDGRLPPEGLPFEGWARDSGHGQDFGEIVTRDSPIHLARAAEGKSPREALRQPEIAEAVRRLVGAAMAGRLKDYTSGGLMRSNGQFTVGTACVPRECGTAEARFVFSSEDVWLGIVEGKRLRLYGDPPRQPRALLTRDRNQVAWRGAIEDMSLPAPTPSMAAPAAVIPVSAGPFQRPRPDADATEVKLRKHGGTLVVPVSINNAITVPFMIDSGASDVSVSTDVMEKLIQAGTLSKADFLGRQTYHLADGSQISSETFRIHVLKVGDREVRDVMGSVSNDKDSMLLGQSFLSRFRSWSIDNQRQVLLLR